VLTAVRFRALAIVLGLLAAAGASVLAPTIATHGAVTRQFGWTVVPGSGTYVVRVLPDSEDGRALRDGDRVIALNGDRRAERVSPLLMRALLAGPSYTVTVKRAGAEVTVPLTTRLGHSVEQWRLCWTLLLVGVVWCVVPTMIAVYRPEQPVARLAYAAGMSIGLFLLSNSPIHPAPWFPHAEEAIVWALFPVAPLHLAFGYDFYLRFPASIASGRVWRGVRAALYTLCGALALYSLASFAAFVAGEQPYFDFRFASARFDPMYVYGTAAAQVLAAGGILAVLARNYRMVAAGDGRRRLRWVAWGTIVGLTPGLVLAVLRVVSIPVAWLRPMLTAWTVPVNIMTTAIPLSFGYAIIKHHVFDITVVVRRGLQYLLARNALRALLSLPVAALAAGAVLHRDRPIGELLLTNSIYLYLIAAAALSLLFRARLTRWVDRRFFRESYNRERMLLSLIGDIERLDSASSVSKIVSHELESAFHPSSLFVWYRDDAKPELTLSYSSGGYIHTPRLSLDSPLVQFSERGEDAVVLPAGGQDGLPADDRQWLADSGVRIIVPMRAADRHLAGLLMLGDKKSDEPYSRDDLTLLAAIARQISVARENARLKERVDHDRRIRHDVLAHLETGHVNLLKECPSCGACYDATATSCAADGVELQLSLPVERTIDGKYRLDRLIGKGGMGAVYEAADLRLARRVAVKIMLGRSFGDRQALRRFEREAQASARLTHPHIVTVFDFGAAGAAGAFIVMELVQGRTLRAELDQRGRLAPVTAAAWFEQLCAAIAAAHQQRIVHRDLKPENVLVTASAAVEAIKVLDFGLAKMTAADGVDSAGITRSGVVVGTAGYMSPEQLTAGAVDERTDIFALGVMVAEAVTGRRPFRGRTHSELLTAMMNDTVTLGGDGPERRLVETILRRAVAREPSSRYETVADFARDLLPALRILPPIDTIAPGDDPAVTAV